jgi:hypothetical protein
LFFTSFFLLTITPRLSYLPAGWFHEVVSASSDGAGHFALNYWYHPPDVASVPGQDSDGHDAAAKQ